MLEKERRTIKTNLQSIFSILGLLKTCMFYIPIFSLDFYSSNDVRMHRMLSYSPFHSNVVLWQMKVNSWRITQRQNPILEKKTS